MNVKTLFFPLSVTITLALGIFMIKPELDTVMTNRQKLSDKQAAAADIDTKVRNATALASDLDNHKDIETSAIRYIPGMRDDDRVVDNVNFLAQQSGLTVTAVKIEKKTEPTPVAISETTPSSGSAVLLANNEDGTQAIDPALFNASPLKRVVMTASVRGSYENVRDAVAKLQRMDRFHEFEEVSVTHAVNTTTGEVVNLDASGALEAVLKISFASFQTTNGKVAAASPVFSQSKFDFATMNKLNQYISSPVTPLEIGASGDTNPFVR